MKKIGKHEIFRHVEKYLSSRGVVLKQGSYAKAVQSGCSFITEAINLGQDGFGAAKTEVEKNLARVRQAIHEATAPTPPAAPPVTPPPAAAKARPKPAARKPKATKTRKAAR